MRGPLIVFNYSKASSEIPEEDVWRIRTLVECLCSAEHFDIAAQMGDIASSSNIYAISAPIELQETTKKVG